MPACYLLLARTQDTRRAHLALREHAALLQQVGLDEAPRQAVLILGELHLQKLSEPRRVVVSQRLRVTERLQDGRRIHYLLLQAGHAALRTARQIPGFFARDERRY